MLPVLIYRMEVVLPIQKLMDMLEKFNKTFLKLILSLPMTTADTAVYVISGGGGVVLYQSRRLCISEF